MSEMQHYQVKDLGQPWWAGHMGFLRSVWVEPQQVPHDWIAVAGMPVDWFSLGRTGARWGPRAIREVSLYMIGIYGHQADRGFIDPHTGEIWDLVEKPPIVDTGDVPIIQSDVTAQTAAAVDHVAEVSRHSKLTITLGGDHYVAYPSCLGVVTGWRDRLENLRVGYLHVDSHPDFFDHMGPLGRFNHGTCVRRISEIPEVNRLAFFGVNGPSIIDPSQFRLMKDNGYQVYTMEYIRRFGPEEAMKQVLEYVASDVDILYTSLDIDVVNAAHAPATHSVVFEGMSARDYLEALRPLAGLENLVGIDTCEVAPPLGPPQRTERLAAMGLLRIIQKHIMTSLGQIPESDRLDVFRV